MDSTYYASDSVTQLSARLTPPARPAFPWRTVFLAWTFGAAAPFALWGLVQNGPGGMMAGLLTLFFTWTIGLLAAAVTATLQKAKYQALGQVWDAKNERLRSAYYCARDDVVVESGRVSNPEQFVTSVFHAPVSANA